MEPVRFCSKYSNQFQSSFSGCFFLLVFRRSFNRKRWLAGFQTASCARDLFSNSGIFQVLVSFLELSFFSPQSGHFFLCFHYIIIIWKRSSSARRELYWSVSHPHQGTKVTGGFPRYLSRFWVVYTGHELSAKITGASRRVTTSVILLRPQ